MSSVRSTIRVRDVSTSRTVVSIPTSLFRPPWDDACHERKQRAASIHAWIRRAERDRGHRTPAMVLGRRTLDCVEGLLAGNDVAGRPAARHARLGCVVARRVVVQLWVALAQGAE